MNRRLIIVIQGVALLLVGGWIGVALSKSIPILPSASVGAATINVSPLSPVGNGFTYQGSLLQNNNPANGQFGMTFSLYDALSGGSQISSTIAVTQTVTDGLFTVSLDFGNTAFLGEARWLEMAVRPVGGTYNTLTPRQPLTPAPYAQSAPWFGISGKPDIYNPLRTDTTITTTDSVGRVGEYSSATVGADGLPLIAYYDDTNRNLKVLHCGGIDCISGNTITTVDATGDVGQYSSTTIGVDGLPIISYYDATLHRLKILHCGNLGCSAGNNITEVQDSLDDIGKYTSITIGTDGFGIISYQNVTRTDLYVAHCLDVRCSTAAPYEVDGSGANFGEGTSIAIGVDGLPFIGYYDATNGDLRGIHCGNLTCDSAPTQTTIDQTGDVGRNVTLTTGSDGLILIIYEEQIDTDNIRLKSIHCSNRDCDSYTSTTWGCGRWPSVVIGSNGLAMVSYYCNTDLKVIRCADLTCSNSNWSTVDEVGDIGSHTSIIRGIDGLPFFSYFDISNLNLKVAHCGNPLCVNYWRER